MSTPDTEEEADEFYCTCTGALRVELGNDGAIIHASCGKPIRTPGDKDQALPGGES